MNYKWIEEKLSDQWLFFLSWSIVLHVLNELCFAHIISWVFNRIVVILSYIIQTDCLSEQFKLDSFAWISYIYCSDCSNNGNRLCHLIFLLFLFLPHFYYIHRSEVESVFGTVISCIHKSCPWNFHWNSNSWNSFVRKLKITWQLMNMNMTTPLANIVSI